MSTPLLRLSFLDLIRGFVAVGRRMSITRAAADLCLTQSAVSRQIRALEDQLGARLLVRSHRAIAFTAEGERLFRSADAAIQQLQDAVGIITERGVTGPVTVTATIGVAGLWLVPRLGQFQQMHPDIELRIAANARVIADLAAEGIDLAIRYCGAHAAPAGAVRLFGERLAPVAHPSLGVTPLQCADDISGHCLLEFDSPGTPWLHWEHWLAARRWDAARPRAMLRFNQYDQVVHAALAGQGIALGRMGLVGPMLADGRLQLLHSAEPVTGTDHAYWLIRGLAAGGKAVEAVVDWIVAEALRDAPLACADRPGS